jgi:hypothetical protein
VDVAVGFAGDLIRRATAHVLAFFPEAETRSTAIEAAEAKARPAPGQKKRRSKRR